MSRCFTIHLCARTTVTMPHKEKHFGPTPMHGDHISGPVMLHVALDSDACTSLHLGLNDRSTLVSLLPDVEGGQWPRQNGAFRKRDNDNHAFGDVPHLQDPQGGRKSKTTAV